MLLQEFKSHLLHCQDCPLHEKKKNYCYDRMGNIHARLVFFAEAPGKEEDEQGIPLVGPSGRLLNRALQELNVPRSSFYCMNSVKCRPPENREPTDHERASCSIWWESELEFIRPRSILALGKVATATLLGTEEVLRIAELRTTSRVVNIGKRDYTLHVTYHPAYVLRSPTIYSIFIYDLEQAIRETYV